MAITVTTKKNEIKNTYGKRFPVHSNFLWIQRRFDCKV